MEKKKNINKSVAAGREYVASYVTFIHFVEKIHQDISGQTAHHESAEGQMPAKLHKH